MLKNDMPTADDYYEIWKSLAQELIAQKSVDMTSAQDREKVRRLQAFYRITRQERFKEQGMSPAEFPWSGGLD